MDRFDNDEARRRDELVREIEHNVEKMSLSEIEALYYDMISKGYISL